MDINSDGKKDLVFGSFEGYAYWIPGKENGFGKPKRILDSANQPVAISFIWDSKKEDFRNVDRSPEGEHHPGDHCTSVAVVDWDDDGDLDLLLGSYQGNLFLRKNIGDKKVAKYAKFNHRVRAAGDFLLVPGGITAPRIADWNGDGLFDIICGGVAGGVYYFENIGQKGKPMFSKKKELVKPLTKKIDIDPKKSSVITSNKNGLPLCPAMCLYAEPVDYDGDGDLDLVVAGRSNWHSEPIRDLTPAEKKRLAEVKVEIKRVNAQIDKYVEIEKTAGSKVQDPGLYNKLISQFEKLQKEHSKLSHLPDKSAEFIWLYRRK